jgi:lipopolysaccharide/colanic/teichoic acid biosynthesis glycosyltransferase
MESPTRRTLHVEEVGEAGATLQLLSPDGAYTKWIKPAIDGIGASLLIVLMSPLLLAATLLVWLSMGRPVFYKQSRVGLGGRQFQLYKLRTMIPDRRTGRDGYVGPERRQTHKSPNDPRVTRVGRMLRSVRFDELPQLWNVVKGDMSLVGPRPELPEIVANYEEWQHRRHDVKPGVTGLWQVSHHNGRPMHECTEVDIAYVAGFSFKGDISILVRTPVAMFHRRGY